MIIGLIEGDALQRHLLKKHLLKHWVCSSELARMETRLLAVRNTHQELLKRFAEFFAVCEMLPFNKSVFEQATDLRAQTALKTPDALHLATAIHAGCDELWTNDKQLGKIASLHLAVVDWSALDAR